MVGLLHSQLEEPAVPVSTCMVSSAIERFGSPEVVELLLSDVQEAGIEAEGDLGLKSALSIGMRENIVAPYLQEFQRGRKPSIRSRTGPTRAFGGEETVRWKLHALQARERAQIQQTSIMRRPGLEGPF